MASDPGSDPFGGSDPSIRPRLRFPSATRQGRLLRNSRTSSILTTARQRGGTIVHKPDLGSSTSVVEFPTLASGSGRLVFMGEKAVADTAVWAGHTRVS